VESVVEEVVELVEGETGVTAVVMSATFERRKEVCALFDPPEVDPEWGSAAVYNVSPTGVEHKTRDRIARQEPEPLLDPDPC